MSHPEFLATVASLSPAQRARLEQVGAGVLVAAGATRRRSVGMRKVVGPAGVVPAGSAARRIPDCAENRRRAPPSRLRMDHVIAAAPEDSAEADRLVELLRACG